MGGVKRADWKGENSKRIIWTFVFIVSPPTHFVIRLCQARKSLFAASAVISGWLD